MPHPSPPQSIDPRRTPVLRSPRGRAGSFPLALLVCTALLPACQYETKVTYDGWGKFKEMGDAKATRIEGDPRNRGEQAYTIMLERFTGRDRLAKAESLAKQLRGTGLPNPDITENAGVVTVSVGRFRDAGGKDAQAMLRRVREAEVGGAKLFATATFIGAQGGRQIFDPLDLKQHVGSYTLQIGFYDNNFQGDRKEAAEKAARQLREEGTEAFFYHGPYLSLVCVGLFTEADFEQSDTPGGFEVQRWGPRIKQVQEKFPYNLANGVTLIEKKKDTGEKIGEQPSCLVRVM